MIGQDNFILVWMENVSLSESSSEKLALRVDSKDYINISGLSGRDKMNFINILSCLQKPAAGKYLFDYKDIGTLDQKSLNLIRRGIGFLFCKLNLIEKFSVYKNIEMPVLSMQKMERDAAIKKAAERLGLTELLETSVKKLTEEQQHKTAIARAIVANPSMIVADEPAEELLETLTHINRSGTAVISFSDKPKQRMNAARNIQFIDGCFLEEIKSDLQREAVL